MTRAKRGPRCPWCGLPLNRYGHSLCRDLERLKRENEGGAAASSAPPLTRSAKALTLIHGEMEWDEYIPF